MLPKESSSWSSDTHTQKAQGICHLTGWINLAFKNVIFLCSVESWELCVSRCAWWRIIFYLLCTISPSFTFWWSQLSLPQRSASSALASVPRVMVSWSEQPFPQAEDISALTLLEEVTTVESRQDVAMTLVKIYLGQGLVVPFLDYLNTREVQHTSKYDTNDPTIVSIRLSRDWTNTLMSQLEMDCWKKIKWKIKQRGIGTTSHLRTN